jgi:hypothetical protein
MASKLAPILWEPLQLIAESALQPMRVIENLFAFLPVIAGKIRRADAAPAPRGYARWLFPSGLEARSSSFVRRASKAVISTVRKLFRQDCRR